MKTINWVTLPFTFLAAAVMLGGCAGAESIDGDESLDAQSGIQIEESTEVQTEPEMTAEAASAVKTPWVCITGACVSFETYGDHLFVWDTVADGHSAVGEISGYGRCWNANGAGTTVDCDFDTAEAAIAFRACTGESGPKQLLTCSPWVWVDASLPK